MKLRAGFSLVAVALLASAPVLTGCTRSPRTTFSVEWFAPSSAPTSTTAVFGDIDGYWSGTWSNSVGESGTESLRFTDNGTGSLTGIWSGTISINGRWLTSTTFQFTGASTTRSYQVYGTVQGKSMSLTYTALRLDATGSYSGQESLTRISTT